MHSHCCKVFCHADRPCFASHFCLVAYLVSKIFQLNKQCCDEHPCPGSHWVHVGLFVWGHVTKRSHYVVQNMHFQFYKVLLIALPSHSNDLHSQQQPSRRVQFSLHPLQCLILSEFFIVASSVGEKWHTFAVLICQKFPFGWRRSW